MVTMGATNSKTVLEDAHRLYVFLVDVILFPLILPSLFLYAIFKFIRRISTTTTTTTTLLKAKARTTTTTTTPMVRKIKETTQSIIGQEEVKLLEIVTGIEDEHEEGFMVERQFVGFLIGLGVSQSGLANTDCCTSWEGVSCDHFGYVIRLDSSESGFVGNIDSNNSLFNLYHLQTVNLANNDFNSSSIPAGFARLNRSLTHLDLSSSNFSGMVPLEISQLTNLISLDLSYFIPYASATSAQEWLSVIASAELHHLQVLTLSDCNLAGSIGTSMLNLSSLSHLDLSDNHITDFPQQMFHLPNLKVLDLSHNSHLTGSLPEFPTGSIIQQLILTDTIFFGRIPHSIGNLKQLAFLVLGGNNFEGEIPSSFSKLSHLEFLDMSSNKLSGPIPSSYANNDLPNLTYLDLSNNQLNGTIPPSLFTLPSLQEMYLDQNKFIGILDDEAFPNSISSPLTMLDLSYNLLEGNIPKFISKFTSLEYLDLSSNNFHGAVDPRMFASLKTFPRSIFHTTS
ncbi:hypothetical protein Scep_002976 [Stephania cephalantha]|uniref:Uncharacterized protein n=1 Tax=Stephania cephalantha TaxID=152367 RepID=A0AAP0Q540_9MAGN